MCILGIESMLPDRRTLQKHQHRSWHQRFCYPSAACTEQGWAEAGQSAGGSGGLLKTERKWRWGSLPKYIFYIFLSGCLYIFFNIFFLCGNGAVHTSVCKYTLCVKLESKCSLTGLAGLAPPSGDTSGSIGDVGAGGGQAHRRHTGCHLNWGGQLQKGDVIVEVLGIVVGVTDGLDGEVGINHRPI